MPWVYVLYVISVIMSPMLMAAEGMWTYDNAPLKKLNQEHTTTIDKTWLDKVRLGSARITGAGGCSASFVSPEGLVLTNHHCVHHCVENLSEGTKNYVADGFYAQSMQQETVCAGMEINQLIDMKNVSDSMNEATKNKVGAEYQTAKKNMMTELERNCANSSDIRCDIVTLYQGGEYWLYKYKRYQDVRLVFAPEFGIAFFGGDPDNFMFPRYNLDMALLRVYENQKPASVPAYLPFSSEGVRDGDSVFVSGHPGKTSRLITISQLEFERDMVLPGRLLYLSELRGRLLEFQKRGQEQHRVANGYLFSVENTFKALKGRHESLLNASFIERKMKEEKSLKQFVKQHSMLKKTTADSWNLISAAQSAAKDYYWRYRLLEGGLGVQSDLFQHARRLVRFAAESSKLPQERLREYTESQWPTQKALLLADTPYSKELEKMTMEFGLTKLRENLGADDAEVKILLGPQSPEQIASNVIDSTQLNDVKFRSQLLEGGPAAIDASKDSMIVFARSMEKASRAIRSKWENEVEAIWAKNSELIAQARFAQLGKNVYPDATFTLRLSEGRVRGWTHRGNQVPSMTWLEDTFKRHTGADPFKLPMSWMKHQNTIQGKIGFNFASTNDIIGGNSGSPVVNTKGEIVGLIFDGNIHSLGGEYGFDETVNRAIAVNSAAIAESLKVIYKTERLLKELNIPKSP